MMALQHILLNFFPFSQFVCLFVFFAFFIYVCKFVLFGVVFTLAGLQAKQPSTSF